MHILHFAFLLSSATLSVHTDSGRRDSVVVDSAARRVVEVSAPPAPAGAGGPLVVALRAGVSWHTATDTSRVASVEYSDWYERRRTIHKWASYAMLPLFAFEYVAGRKLRDESTDAPGWAKSGHGVAATGVAALFVVNTVTGGWNLWEARKDPAGRKWRTAHAVLMLAADAGFTATGLLAEKAEGSPENRRRHRNIAISSMAVATASYLMMLPPLRRD